jgi:protein involved in polysaccharide export with SLBB domain
MEPASSLGFPAWEFDPSPVTTTFFRGMRPMRTLIASLAFAMLVLTLPAAAQEPAGTKAQAVLTPGDSVRIEVWRKPEFSGDFVVAPDGTITHPLFRSVRVGGLPFATAEANLRTFLGQFEENPQFVMEPLIRVAVSGEVTRPIVYAARPETSIGEAVARAGGTTQFAARSRVRVIRIEPNGAQQQILINLADPSSTEGTLPVRSGDQIVVDRRKSFFRDIMVPALGIIGSIASLGLLIDRVSRQN